MAGFDDRSGQIAAVLALLPAILPRAPLALYLHGSAVAGDFGPHSDIDLLLVTDRPLTDDERRGLLDGLLRISAPHPPGPGDGRCLELTVFDRAGLIRPAYPAQADFVYGEWLRAEFAAGMLPRTQRDPELTLLLAQAYHAALALIGPEAQGLLPVIPLADIRQAMRDLLPGLMAGLSADTRNVLLTLARIWRTAVTGDFLSKEQAARWAMARLGPIAAAVLDHARGIAAGERPEGWATGKQPVEALARELHRHIHAALQD